jgi:hypothetical protein
VSGELSDLVLCDMDAFGLLLTIAVDVVRIGRLLRCT